MKQWINGMVYALLSVTVVAVQAQEGVWETFDYPELNSFEMPDLEIFELDNGIRFYLVEDSELPLVNLSVLVRTGGVVVPDDKTGLNSLTGTVMRSGGSEQYPGNELDELLESRAAVMETSIGFTSGSATMNVLSDDFAELLPVFVDLLRNPAFPQDRIDLAKTQQRSAISRRNDEQGAVARREFQRVIYGEDSSYARRIEYRHLLNISREDMMDFHARSFVGENLAIGVVGDFETDAMRSVLEEAFSGIERGPIPVRKADCWKSSSVWPIQRIPTAIRSSAGLRTSRQPQ